MEVVLNKCIGGFGVSESVMDDLGLDCIDLLDNEDLGIKSRNQEAYRSDQRLIASIKKIGLEKSSSDYADLVIVDIPDGMEWHITDYDGMETLHENHRSW